MPPYILRNLECSGRGLVFVNLECWRIHTSQKSQTAMLSQISSRIISISVHQARSRALYRSKYRGTRENCYIFGTFAQQRVPSMSQQELDLYETVLAQEDPDLYDWITGVKEIPPELESNSVFKEILQWSDDHRENLDSNR